MSKTLQSVTVRNRSGQSVERAGHIWPPRATRTVNVSVRRLREITACTALAVESAPAAAHHVADDWNIAVPSDHYRGALDEYTIVQLRDIARHLDVPVSGSKDELIARIVEAGY